MQNAGRPILIKAIEEENKKLKKQWSGKSPLLLFLGMVSLMLFLGLKQPLIALIPILVGATYWGLTYWSSMRQISGLKKELDAFMRSPRGELHKKMDKIGQDLGKYEQKVRDYEKSIAEGMSYQTKLALSLQDEHIFENRKEKNQVLLRGLEKNLSYKRLILEFYKEASKRIQRILRNLEQDLNTLDVVEYLKGESDENYREFTELASSQLNADFLDDLERIETSLPGVQVDELSSELQLQLEDMIALLKTDTLKQGDADWSEFKGDEETEKKDREQRGWEVE